jgi:hypothetical protein
MIEFPQQGDHARKTDTHTERERDGEEKDLEVDDVLVVELSQQGNLANGREKTEKKEIKQTRVKMRENEYLEVHDVLMVQLPQQGNLADGGRRDTLILTLRVCVSVCTSTVTTV